MMRRKKNSLRAQQMRWAKRLLRSKGVSFEGTIKGVGAALVAAQLVPDGTRPGKAISNVWLIGREITAKGLLPCHCTRDFYQTRAWQKLARQTKARYGRKCMKCGATEADGVRIVSDHVISVRARWDLRLDPANIQVLCEGCNRAKGSIDAADYRLAVEAMAARGQG